LKYATNELNYLIIQQTKILYNKICTYDINTTKILDKILNAFISLEIEDLQTFFGIFQLILKKINKPAFLLTLKDKIYNENISQITDFIKFINDQ
jgi:hypothetical protein